jgi:LCP family protein required for cell wall assembly
MVAVATLVGVVVVRGLGAVPTSTPALAQSAAVEIHSAHGSSFVPALEGKRPLFILVMGSDARPGEPILRERSDSIHIIGVNRERTKATILGFPRDSWVPIPGHGTTKINAAMQFGGPDLMVATIENLTGIHIDFWMLTSFDGIQRMVEGIKGLVVNVPYAMHDQYSHANFSAGKHRLKGWQVLAFARNRHDTPNGDFSRSYNQGILFLSALTQLRSQFRKDPAALFSWMTSAWRNMNTDLSPETLVDLAISATQVPADHVTNLVVPASTGTVGAASVVFISGSASSVFRDLRADGVVGKG